MLGTFHSIWTFDVEDSASWNLAGKEALKILQQKIGFISGEIFHNADSPERYLVKTDWLDVGSYRRALGSMEAKLSVWPFLVGMRDEPTAFEKLFTLDTESFIEYDSSVNGSIPESS